MKYFSLLIIVLHITYVNAQDGQHDWLLKNQGKHLAVNTSETEVAYLDKSRLSIFDLNTGFELRSMELQLPEKDKGFNLYYIENYSDDFEHFILKANNNNYRYDAETQQLSAPFRKGRDFFYGIDHANRDIIRYEDKNKVVISENGKPIHTIKKAKNFVILRGGLYGFYKIGKKAYQIDLKTLESKEIKFLEKHRLFSADRKSPYHWIIGEYKGKERYYNPYTGETKEVHQVGENWGISKCNKNFNSVTVFYGKNFYYVLEPNANQFAYFPTMDYTPYQITKYDIATCKSVMAIQPTFSDLDFSEKHPDVKSFEVSVDKAAKKIEKEAADKKRTEERKQFFSSFPELNPAFTEIDLSTVQGRSLKGVVLFEKLFSNNPKFKPENFFAIGQIKDCYDSKLLIYLERQPRNAYVVIRRVSTKAVVDWGAKTVLHVPIENNQLTEKSLITFKEFGNQLTVKVSKTNLKHKYPKPAKETFYLNCNGKW